MCKMKRFLLILCLIGAVFALVACGEFKSADEVRVLIKYAEI